MTDQRRFVAKIEFSIDEKRKNFITKKGKTKSPERVILLLLLFD